MKYYKAFNRELRCREFQYVEGETYEIEEVPVLCRRGFHFCKDLVLTLSYYSVDNILDNLYAEVELLGDVVFEQPTQHKGVTNKIKIVKVLSDEEVLALINDNDNSGHWNSGHWNSGHGNSGYGNSGNDNSGSKNSGYGNSGHNNSSYGNSGHNNSGSNNSGSNNSGSNNSGSNNSGSNNSGHNNSGHSNSGHSNSGHNNSGHSNSGHSNSGHWNSCDNESGSFNSVNLRTTRAFNAECLQSDLDAAYYPDFLQFSINETETYKQAFKRSWDAADHNDRERVKELPNFDANIFCDISGIDINK